MEEAKFNVASTGRPDLSKDQPLPNRLVKRIYKEPGYMSNMLDRKQAHGNSNNLGILSKIGRIVGRFGSYKDFGLFGKNVFSSTSWIRRFVTDQATDGEVLNPNSGTLEKLSSEEHEQDKVVPWWLKTRS